MDKTLALRVTKIAEDIQAILCTPENGFEMLHETYQDGDSVFLVVATRDRHWGQFICIDSVALSVTGSGSARWRRISPRITLAL